MKPLSKNPAKSGFGASIRRQMRSLRPRQATVGDWLDMPAGCPNVPPAPLQMTDWPEPGARERVAQNDRRQR